MRDFAVIHDKPRPRQRLLWLLNDPLVGEPDLDLCSLNGRVAEKSAFRDGTADQGQVIFLREIARGLPDNLSQRECSARFESSCAGFPLPRPPACY